MPHILLRKRLVGALFAAGVAAIAAPSAAGAAAWVPPVSLPGPADSPAGADVAAAPDGTVIAVWTRTEAGKPQVVASVRPPGGAFSPPAPISAPNALNPRIAIDGNGTATVVWQQLSTLTARFKIQQTTRPAGGGFGVPRDLSSEADESEVPDIAVNSAGTTIVAWESTKPTGTNHVTIEAAARPAGGVFGDRKQLSSLSTTLDMHDPRAAVGEDGTGMVTWAREGDDAEAARFTLGGGFGGFFQIAASDDFVDFPDVAIDAQGNAVFAYFANEAGTPAIRTQTRSAGGALSSTAAVAPLAISSPTAATLLADRGGNILLTWSERRVSPADVSIIRAATRPNGQGFQGVASLSGTVGSLAPFASAISPSGDAVVAWVAPGQRVQARIKPRGTVTFGAVQNDFPVRTGITKIAAFADGEGNLGTLWRRTGSGDPGTMELRAFDGSAPKPLGVEKPAEAVVGRPAGLAAAFRDTWSPFTVAWTFGDGGTATGGTVQHAYAAPGAVTATATAADNAGNASAQSARLAVRGLRPDEIDADRDGFSAAQDCDDGNPRIRPGAIEIPGNAIDENCDGRRDPFPRVSANASIGAFFGPRFTQLERVQVTGLDGGETVKLRCKGRGCRKSMNATVRIKRKRALLKFGKRVRGVRLKKGARLQVTVSRPGFVAKVFRFTIRLNALAKRTELCQLPGATKPGKC